VLALLVVLAWQTATPFFTNDLAGWMKVAGLGVALIGSIYKLMTGPVQRSVEKVTNDVDGIGAKVNGLETRESGALERIRASEHATGTLREELNRMHHDMGELKAEVRRSIDENHDMKIDIIGAINDAKREHAAQLGDATKAQAERDSRISQRIMRLETIAEIRGFLPRDAAHQEGGP
jgi:hypothetical protein